jgi:hypothetical protein
MYIDIVKYVLLYCLVISFEGGIKARIYVCSAMAVLRNGLEIKVTQQGSYLNGIGMGKQREIHHYLPPETGLPQDWTY